jgi:hypothetical protein
VIFSQEMVHAGEEASTCDPDHMGDKGLFTFSQSFIQLLKRSSHPLIPESGHENRPDNCHNH